MAGFSGCVAASEEGGGEGGSLGRRKARWVPDTHCPRRLLLRDETSKRGRGSRARRRGFRRNGKGKSETESTAVEQPEPSDGQTDGLRLLSFLLTRLLLLHSRSSPLSFSCCFPSRARALPSQNHLCMLGRSPRQ